MEIKIVEDHLIRVLTVKEFIVKKQAIGCFNGETKFCSRTLLVKFNCGGEDISFVLNKDDISDLTTDVEYIDKVVKHIEYWLKNDKVFSWEKLKERMIESLNGKWINTQRI